ncbi:MAG: HAMP domain-containing histidine kinase [candidate division KSB1 bacterium]|nr:HAMP domain-containing histidine kinase [candidate division KSB1 bacterium]
MSTRFRLLRWVLVLATVYLVWFSRAEGRVPWIVPAYVLIYLFSTPVVHHYVRRNLLDRRVLLGLVTFDLSFVSVGLVLAHRAQLDFYPVVFLSLFIAAVALNLRAAVAAAVLLGTVHLTATASVTPGSIWMHTEELLRLPFLLAAAAFFGYLCQEQRRRIRLRARTQRQRDRLQALAAAAHDIRSPLANVVSLAEMLLAGDAGELNRDQRDLLERAHTDLWRIVRRATNLMDAARLDRQGLPLDLEPTDLRQVCEEVMHAMATAARIRRLQLIFEHEASATGVMADRAQIERALSNLLDNAIKYSPSNGVVKLRLFNPDPASVAVEVLDQGPGIPSDERESAFRAFARRHSGPPLSGSGLGLFIVRKIVEGHRGLVTLDSSPGGGVCARVVLPLVAEGHASREANVGDPQSLEQPSSFGNGVTTSPT